MRGEFLRGAGTAYRDAGTGTAVGVHQDPTKMPIIGCNSNGITWTPNANDEGGKSTERDKAIFVKQGTVGEGKVVNKTSTWTEPGVSNLPVGYTARPTNTAVLYCIKYA